MKAGFGWMTSYTEVGDQIRSQFPNCTIRTSNRTTAGDPSGPIDLRVISLCCAPFPQQGHRSPLTVAAKQQRISKGRALDDLTRPFVASRNLHANREVCAALNQ